jgi:hypothetical protein
MVRINKASAGQTDFTIFSEFLYMDEKTAERITQLDQVHNPKIIIAFKPKNPVSSFLNLNIVPLTGHAIHRCCYAGEWSSER